MKKLIILIAMLMASSAYADMDRVCMIVMEEVDISELREKIAKYNCERNNVLEVFANKNDAYTRRSLLLVSNQFCRFDRNRNIEGNILSCILYSPKPRRDP